MSTIIEKFKEKALSTEYPRWKNILSSCVLSFLCISVASAFWYLFLTVDKMECHKGFAILSFPWLVVEFLIVYYLFKSNTVPRYATDSMVLLVAFSNIWFGLFLFGLKPCT